MEITLTELAEALIYDGALSDIFANGATIGPDTVVRALPGYSAAAHQKVGQQLNDQTALVRLAWTSAFTALLSQQRPVWVDLVLQAGWSAVAGYATPGYYIDLLTGRTNLRGAIAGPVGSTAFSLSAPGVKLALPTVGVISGSTVATYLDVSSTGVAAPALNPGGTFSLLTLEGVSFRV